MGISAVTAVGIGTGLKLSGVLTLVLEYEDVETAPGSKAILISEGLAEELGSVGASDLGRVEEEEEGMRGLGALRWEGAGMEVSVVRR